MTTQYTPILKLALPVTGELSGTWGDVVNDNITSMVEQAIAGLATISTWSANSHTLTTANGTTSESRCAMLVAQDGAGLAASGEIVCPASSKLYVLKNATSYQITLKTASGTGVAVASGNTAFLFCDGTNVNACVTTIVDGRVTGNLTVDGNATINGNTTLGNATSDTITATARFASDLVPSTDNARDLGSASNSWKDLYIDGTATMALVAISGGTINGVSIGATTPATFIAVDNLSFDGNTITSTNTNGNIVIAPNGTGDVQLDADTVRVGDSGAAATLTSNGAGALTVTTGGAANLVLSTNSGTDSGTITINNGANGNISIVPNGTGDVQLDADTVRIGDANTDVTLTSNGTGNLNLSTNGGTNSGTIQIAQGANGSISLTPNGTGTTVIKNPSISGTTTFNDGNANTVIYLNGSKQATTSTNLQYSGTDLTVYGITVGRGAGAEATNTAVGASALATNTTGAFNTAIGYGALDASSTANYNTAVGYYSLGANTSGTENTAIGYRVMPETTTGQQNAAVGSDAMLSNTSGSYNVAIGKRALFGNTTGAGNVALGNTALYSNTTTGGHVAIGNGALFYSNTTGTGSNIAIGSGAGYSITTGMGHIAIGQGALYENTTGAANTAVGGYDGSSAAAMRFNTTGSYNSAFGVGALASNTTASNNTAVGYQAGYSNTVGTQNLFLGYAAGYSNTTGTYNTAAGHQAGLNITTGTNNALFGRGAGYTVGGSSSNNTAIGDAAMYYSTGASDNTAIGQFSLAYSTGASNTAVGSNAGNAITTGSKNTILGRFSGNQGGLDIRTASNYIVLSDGDGNPRGVFDNSGTFIVNRSANGVHVQTQVSGVNTAALGSFNGAATVGANSSGYSGIMFNGASIEPTLDGLNVRQSAVVDIGSTNYRFKLGCFTGINFPATQSASSNANTLDDYEEGTWTPALRGSGTAGTFNLGTAVGKYTKIGNMVTLYCAITVTSVSGSPTGDLQITGIPFAVATGTSGNGAAQTQYVGFTQNATVSFSTRGSISVLYLCAVNGSQQAVVCQANAVGGSAIVDFCISYPT